MTDERQVNTVNIVVNDVSYKKSDKSTQKVIDKGVSKLHARISEYEQTALKSPASVMTIHLFMTLSERNSMCTNAELTKFSSAYSTRYITMSLSSSLITAKNRTPKSIFPTLRRFPIPMLCKDGALWQFSKN